MMRWGWHGCCGLDWGMPLFGLGPLVLIAIVGAAIYYFTRWEAQDDRPTGPSSRETLDRRYVSGELAKEQYEQMKAD